MKKPDLTPSQIAALEEEIRRIDFLDMGRGYIYVRYMRDTSWSMAVRMGRWDSKRWPYNDRAVELCLVAKYFPDDFRHITGNMSDIY